MKRTVAGCSHPALLTTLAAGLLAESLGAQAQVLPHGASPGEPTAEPAGEARQIVQQALGYRSWARFPDYQRPKLSRAHWSAYVVAYFNLAAASAARTRDAPFPDGSILVKENRLQPDGQPTALSIMAKQGNAWYWIQATPGGRVFTTSGKPLSGRDVASCAGCHSAAPHDGVYSR